MQLPSAKHPVSGSRLGSQGRTANARAVAAAVLTEVLVEGRSLTNALQLPANGPDNALIQELCYGVLRWYSRLDAILAQLLSKPLRSKDRDLGLLILLGLYQLDFMRVAPHAALGETVEAARTLGKPWAVGLVNALLRKYQRNPQQWQAMADCSENARLAFPAWLLDRLRRSWPQHWARICEVSNQRPPMSLRVNARKLSRDEYLSRLRTADMSAQPLTAVAQGVILEQPIAVERLPGFAAGQISVQDSGAQLAAVLLNPQPGERVLDACAAPGGKTCHLLEYQPAIAGLTAIDSDEVRLDRLVSNLQRLGLEARIRTGDATAPAGDWAAETYQRILLDVPCSATGVIRRHPDIKWLRRARDIGALRAVQAKMLDAMWSLLAPGGMLLYCTCSLLPEENEYQIQTFLNRTANAREKPIESDWGHVRRHGRQTLPGELEMDGFYYACLEKV